MKVFLAVYPEEKVIEVRARAEGEGGMVGDLNEEVHPGESFLGWTYDELLRLGDGEHILQE